VEKKVKEKLNPKILEILKKRTGLKEESIKVRISEIRNKYPYLTLNAAAYLYAKKRNISVTRYLLNKDRETLEKIKVEKIPVKLPKLQRKQIIEIAKYETNNRFLKAHIDEINKAYTHKCYTACFVIMRKVLENLIVEILRKKYPEKKKEHMEKYFDFNRKRNHDFNKLLNNLKESSKDFNTEKKIVERICELADKFRERANEMTHSLYHIATKKEIDESNFQDMLTLIKEVFKKHFGEEE
jgi:hypothetical protein